VGTSERNERNRGKEMRFMRRIIMALMLASLAAGAVAGAAWVLVAPPAKAAFPGHNGRIVFWREDSNGVVQIWVADKDLSNQEQLTSKSAESGWAAWKPGGAKLVFASTRADPDPTDARTIVDIFKMNPDGTGVVKLTDSKALDADPGWSPDGRKIAFDSDRADRPGRGEIHVMDSDGTNVRRVTTLPADAMLDLAPRFSPDGRRLVFTRYKNLKEPGLSALFTVRVDGGGLKRLTPWSNGANNAHWSPNGKKLVFEAFPLAKPSCHGDIYTVDSDGQHLTNITNNRCQAGSSDPVWSPNGKKILFLQRRAEGDEVSPPGFGLAKMNPDGSARHFISPNPEEGHWPDWESVR
jgi:Tol biopolymer transport system component